MVNFRSCSWRGSLLDRSSSYRAAPGSPADSRPSDRGPTRHRRECRCVDGGRDRDPVTSAAVLIGWRAVPRRHVGESARRGALALGCVAALMIGIVGCTNVTNGTARRYQVAPAYRASVSASVSASAATSSMRESQRQQSLTAKAVRTSCDALAYDQQRRDRQGERLRRRVQRRATAPARPKARRIDALQRQRRPGRQAAIGDALSSQTAGRVQRLDRRGRGGGQRDRHARADRRSSTSGSTGSTTPRPKALNLCMGIS